MSILERMADLVPMAEHLTTQEERADGGIRPTGMEIFAAKTTEEQDAMLGLEAAAAVRAGDIQLADLVAKSEMDSDQPDWLTQKPLDAVT